VTSGPGRRTLGVALSLAVLACDAARRGATDAPLLDLLAPEQTGIDFANTLPSPDNPAFNILNYLYYYNGGGVAVGDVDGDGLQDLYFSSNLERNRLYRNKGNFEFEDITERAGVAGPPGWKTGVTMADVNGDGHVDIHVAAVRYLSMEGRNALYINNGNGTFTERAAEYGLDFAGYSTQAAFFDYDGDGDLDMYLLNHSTHTERAIGVAARRDERHATAGDRLYRNDGARFTDVSAAAGIYGGLEGFGLGVVASDVNGDGCLDIYVANDFQENDFLYVNNCNGTFTESMARAMPHSSRFSMGVDAADFNNDGRSDVFVADMLPEREDVLKTSASSEGYNLFNLRLRAGYHPQYPRNTLQLNRGGLRFSDVGYLAGVFASDWSWAALFADLDNDGWKDLVVTNGIYRRPNDLDYINYVGNEAVQAALARGIRQADLELLQRMPQIPLPNHIWRNNGDLTFQDVATAWGAAQPGFSNGAAYVDLDNDGALDLVVNRLNAPAAVYRNRSRERNGHAYLTVQLRGSGANTAGIGAHVTAVQGGSRQVLEQMPTRGFQSSVDPRVHFGLGTAARVDSLIVRWPDRRVQILTEVAVNRTITLVQDSARQETDVRTSLAAATLLEDVSREFPEIRHRENAFLDYEREPLMPHVLSTEGPALAVGDVNGDGLDDMFVGGAKWQAGRLLVQRDDGSFRDASTRALGADSLAEDVDAVFFDADGDGDQDLYVVSGGNEFWGESDALRDRLYLNDGRGEFTRAPAGALPDLFDTGGCVAAADYDGDGDVDLFVGSRVVPRRYGEIPESRLLENDGSGHFREVTREVAPGLLRAGMVGSAAWSDTNADGALDLVVVGEWMPVRIYRQKDGRFVESTEQAGLSLSHGWWNSVTVADINRDGHPDLLLGNLGLNAYLRATPERPAQLHVHDFGNTGTLKQVLTFYKGGVSYPLAGRDDLVRLIPALRSRYPTYADFAASRYEEIFTAGERARAAVLEAHTFASAVALNDGRGGFALQALPNEAQLSPLYALLPLDANGDGHQDVLAAGNFHGVPPMLGRYDAGYGVLLRGDGAGGLQPFPAGAAPVLEGEVRDLSFLRHASGSTLVVVARNNAPLQFLRLRDER
jgi:enediyne biosynthesis protein E4